ncbi:hypothetical protein GGR42_003415 [Saonia flava]|uniref:Uncharacterized protein n=1 Tax=Saonia flava TaxID=523696 RepID=A0A846R0E8_9FLAO|nr:hypothetical protein [Saonia flava]NJB72917.1 hypothetical protein [Saonia flava]
MKLIIGIIIVLIGVFIVLKKRNIEKTKSYKWNLENENLKTDFTNILSKKPNLEYLIVEFDSYYIQYKGFVKSKEFYSEIVSNEFLDEKNQYSENQKNGIFSLGFLEPKKKDSDGNISPNYSKWYGAKSKNEIDLIFNELIKILESIYGLKKGTEIKLRW